MQRVAEAVSYGAVTVVNAMATGMGAALGVGLCTKARVTITEQAGRISGQNLTEPRGGNELIEASVRRVFRRFNVHRLGAHVETSSNIPVAAGLKSSSSASNAIILATLRALGKKVSDLEAVRLGVDASLEAGVTLTGAFDDAYACYFGGLVVTDNRNRRVLGRFSPKGSLRVLIHVPKQKKYTKDVDPDQLSGIRPVVAIAHREALRGNYWYSLTLNGLFYSLALGYDISPATQAIEAGAVAAGISGKGPSTAAIVPHPKVRDITSVWRRLSGRVIETSVNHRKAHAGLVLAS